MVMPLGANGGPNLGIVAAPPPESVLKLRPYLQVAIVGCAVSIIGKFIGRQQSTALSDLFPLIFGCVLLYSQSHFHSCVSIFVLFAVMASVFSTFYLASELGTVGSGGRNFFASTCPASFEIDFRKTNPLKVCNADDGAFGNCRKPLTCSNSTLSPTLELASASTSQRLYMWQDMCDAYTIVGHISLLLSVLFNYVAAFIGWKMMTGAFANAQALSEETGLTQTAREPAFEAFDGEGRTLDSA